MKTRLPIMILLSVILLFVCCTGYLHAGNPTSYVTIHDPYFRVAEGSTSYAFAQTLQVLYGGYIPYFRMFIPPGTIVLDLLIQEGGKQMAMSHHETPPTTPLPSGYSEISKKYTLDQLEAGDCLSTESLQGNLYIAHDSFLPPYLPLSRGGWLYVKVGGGSYSQVYYTMFTVEVNTKIYNEWWDKYMAKPDGTNNWNRDVESVEKYVDPTTMAVSVTPTNQNVPKEAGATTFSVSNTETGTMPWTAAVVPGSSWLTITSGTSGTDAGTINCSFTANTSTSARTGIIRVTATGATGSPVDVTVTQAPTPVTLILTVTPTNQNVPKEAGATTFSVSNTGTGTMPWTAAVVTGSSWLTITSGTSGTDAGTINCSFTANTSPSVIIGTIRVTALGATGSPVDVTVTQAPASKTPAKPTADPSSGWEFSSSLAQVKVTSTKATQIHYTLTSSTDGSQPDEPSIPIPSFPKGLEGKQLNENESGYYGTLDLPYIAGLKTYTIYKVRFQGKNASGTGEVSDVLQYIVNKPIKQADAKKNPGVDYTDSIRKPGGLIDPLKKFLIPESATSAEYSVEDLVLKYLRILYSLPSISIETRICKSGTVLIVKDDSWGGAIVPLIVEKIFSNADADPMKVVASSGNIEIIYKNILIVLNMAGAYEDQLTQMVEGYGMRLDYGSGHTVEISSDSDGLRAYKCVYRYQLGAKDPSPLSSGDSYTAGLSVGDSIQVDDADTIKITYDDGTTQNLIPGVIDADVLINLMKDKDGTKTKIDPTTGYVTTDNNGKIWTGLPDCRFFLHEDSVASYTHTDDQIVFYSKAGTQYIYKKR